MNSIQTNRRAVVAAKVYLEMRGYEIIELHWHHSRCSIDIVAKRSENMYLVEVKYRGLDFLSTDTEILTKSRQQQLYLAAESWVEEHKWHGKYYLSVVEIAGRDYSVMSFTDSIA